MFTELSQYPFYTRGLTSELVYCSYTSLIFNPQIVWNSPVPLVDPGKFEFFSICCVISP